MDWMTKDANLIAYNTHGIPIEHFSFFNNLTLNQTIAGVIESITFTPDIAEGIVQATTSRGKSHRVINASEGSGTLTIEMIADGGPLELGLRKMASMFTKVINNKAVDIPFEKLFAFDIDIIISNRPEQNQKCFNVLIDPYTFEDTTWNGDYPKGTVKFFVGSSK